MKITVRILALLLSVCSLFCVSCSLFKKPEETDKKDTPVTQEVTETLMQVGDKSTDYVIVYGTGYNTQMANIGPKFSRIYSLSPKMYKDSAREAGEKEILIGVTNRTISAELAAAVEAQALAEGGLTWGYLYKNGQFAIYATDATAYNGVTSWAKCYDDFEATFLGESFSAVVGKIVIHSVNKAILDAQQAEEERAAAEERGAVIATIQTKINGYKLSDFGSVKSVTKVSSPSVTPAANTHPRLSLNDSDVANLNQLIETGNKINPQIALYKYGENQNIYKEVCETTDDKSVQSLNFGKLSSTPADTSNFTYGTLETIEALAFRYVLEHKAGAVNDEASVYGYRAVLGLLNFLSTVYITDSDDLRYRAAGYVMYISAEVYDWCYDLMTDEQRAFVVARITSYVALKLEICSGTNPTPSGQGAITGHGAEAQLLRDWLAFAIAVYDEYPDYYNYVGTRLLNEYAPVRNVIYASGTFCQGSGYGYYRNEFESVAALFFETMQCKENPTALYTFDMEAFGLGIIQYIRPDGTLFRLGDGTAERVAASSDVNTAKYKMYDYAKSMFYLYAYTKNGVMKSEAYKYLNNFDTFFNDDNSLTQVQFLIYNDPRIEKVSRDTLDKTVTFGSPVGATVARNGWDSDGAVVYMKIGEKYTAGHEHLDMGSFLIYYKGSLAIDAGFYDSYSSSVESYTRSTKAHNTLLIGGKGQEVSVNRAEPTTIEGMVNTGDVIGEMTVTNDAGNPIIAYLAGDLYGSYSGTGATEVKRYMLAVYNYDEDGNATDTPLTFFVMDRVVTSTAKETTFMLHGEEAPEKTGGAIVFKNTKTYKNNGKTYTNSGVLVDQAFVAGQSSYTYREVAGAYGEGNPTPETRWNYEPGFIESGWGRVEIANTGTETNMLNVMYVTDTTEYGSGNVHAATKYENATVLGASIADLGVAAFFNKTSEALSSATVEGTGTGTLRYAVCGLAAGTYTVRNAASATVATVTVTAESGMLGFSAPAGVYTISR